MIRYAPLVKRRGAKVIVQCQKALAHLLAGCEGIDQLIPVGQAIPDFDVQLPLMSLPAVLGTSLDTIPAAIPYLSAQQALTEQWRKKLEPLDGLQVGIRWQGNLKYHRDRSRSIPLVQFAPLSQVPDVRLISLQQGVGSEQLDADCIEFPVTNFGEELDDTSRPLMDTAALIANLDLVITSDTVIAHLAGALGATVWLALSHIPDWRWQLQREDSPWYPTMRLFRQPCPGDWESVFRNLPAALTGAVSHQGKGGRNAAGIGVRE